MSNKDEFFDELVGAIAKNLSEGSILAFSIAERLRKDDNFLVRVLEKLEPKVLADSLAQQIVYANNQNTKQKHVNEKAVATYRKILIDARQLAAEKIAADMAAQIQQEVKVI